MKRILLIAGILLAFSSYAHATAHLVNNTRCGFVSSVSTLTCSIPSPSSPDVYFITNWSTGARIASVVGCGQTFQRVYLGGFNGSFQDIFIAANLTPGSPCSVLVTFDGTVNPAIVSQGEYVGVAAKPFAFMPEGDDNSVFIPSQVGGAVYHFQTYEPNDLLLMIGESFNDCDGFQSTGGVSMTSHPSINASDHDLGPPPCNLNNLGLIQYMDAVIPTVGTYSTTVVNTTGANSFFYPIIIRSQMPTGPAVVESVPCSTKNLTGANSFTCTPLTPMTAGDQYFVPYELSPVNVDAVLAGLQDTDGSCYLLPSEWGNANVGFGNICSGTAGTIPTFTLNSASNISGDMTVEEVQGVSATAPLYSGTAHTNVFAANIGPNTTTQDTGDITIPGGQCYLLVGFGGGSSPVIYTPSNGFVQRSTPPWNYANNIQELFDQTVCPGSSINTGFDNVITVATPQGGLESGTWALGVNTNTDFPVVSQTYPTEASGFGTLLNPVKANAAITVCAVGSGMSDLTIASSPSLIWTPRAGGGPSDVYATWTTTGAPSGNLQIAVTGSGSGFVLWNAIENDNVGGVDQWNSAFSASGAPLDPSITTTANEEWLNSCSVTVTDRTASFGLQQDNSWQLNQNEPTDFAYADGWSKFGPVAGSYDDLFNFQSVQPSAVTIISFFGLPQTPGTGSQYYGNSQHLGNSQIR